MNALQRQVVGTTPTALISVDTSKPNRGHYISWFFLSLLPSHSQHYYHVKCLTHWNLFLTENLHLAQNSSVEAKHTTPWLVLEESPFPFKRCRRLSSILGILFHKEFAVSASAKRKILCFQPLVDRARCDSVKSLNTYLVSCG